MSGRGYRLQTAHLESHRWRCFARKPANRRPNCGDREGLRHHCNLGDYNDEKNRLYVRGRQTNKHMLQRAELGYKHPSPIYMISILTNSRDSRCPRPDRVGGVSRSSSKPLGVSPRLVCTHYPSRTPRPSPFEAIMTRWKGHGYMLGDEACPSKTASLRLMDVEFAHPWHKSELSTLQPFSYNVSTSDSCTWGKHREIN